MLDKDEGQAVTVLLRRWNKVEAEPVGVEVKKCAARMDIERKANKDVEATEETECAQSQQRNCWSKGKSLKENGQLNWVLDTWGRCAIPECTALEEEGGQT